MSHAHEHDSHGSVKSYLVGFVLSVILTAIPFWLVMHGGLTKQATMFAIFAFAAVQIVVHLKYFLHLNFSEKGKLNTWSFMFTALIIAMLLGLSIWIIYSADALMMRT